MEERNINKFFKISKEEFDKVDEFNKYNTKYEDIKLPLRATKGSGGYDFFAPYDIHIYPGRGVKIPTGIRVRLNQGRVLLCFPRSSLGFKYKLKLDNTVGVIDSDYFYSDNEGHIWVSMTNMSSDKVCYIQKGDAMFQGIIMPFELTIDDNVTNIRNGGFGSTDKKN